MVKILRALNDALQILLLLFFVQIFRKLIKIRTKTVTSRELPRYYQYSKLHVHTLHVHVTRFHGPRFVRTIDHRGKQIAKCLHNKMG